jgi:hypothetical protein
MSILRGAAIGGVFGYFLTVAVSCYILYPESNLCGFTGIVIGLPAGFALGAIAAAIRKRS